MIRIDWVQEIEGVSVYRDDTDRSMFYLLPNQPRFRLDDAKKPVFRYLKYRTPIDRPGGKKGGGYVIFDSEFVVPDDKLAKVKAALADQLTKEHVTPPDPKFGSITFTRGTATLQILDSGGALVQKIQSAGKPSLFGHNVCAWTAELSEAGAPVAGAALKSEGGGAAQVIYDLYFMVKLPPISGYVWFNAENFYSYYQQADRNRDHWWSSRDRMSDTRREEFRKSDSGGVQLDFNWSLPDAEQDKALKKRIEDFLWGTLEDAVKRLVLSDPTANTETGLPDGVNHVTRDFETVKKASFYRSVTENMAVEWHAMPQGTLPNITSLGFEWDKYASTIDADDPFFRTLESHVGVNAEFEKYGIASVDVNVQYGGKTLKPVGKDAAGNAIVPHFTSPDQRVVFESYVEADDWRYTYGYTVHYKGESRVFESKGNVTEAEVLTIDVGDLGLVYIDVAAGTINWDQVACATLLLEYEDPAQDVSKVTKQLKLTKASPRATWRELILARRTKPYRYIVTYDMADGTRLAMEPREGTSDELYVDDPFYVKVVGVRPLMDFDRDVKTAYIDLVYADAARDYTQRKSIALSKNMSFFDWSFPAFDGSKGKVSYSGKVQYTDGTTEDIPVTEEPGDTVYPKIPNVLEVRIEPALLDWSKLKLATVHLEYHDPANHVDADENLAVKQGTSPAPWRVRIKDKTKKSFTWSARFFPADSGAMRPVGPITTSESLVVLEMPT